MTLDAGVARGGQLARMRELCHMTVVPGVLFAFDDDLLGRIKYRRRHTEDADAAYHFVKLRSTGERDLKAS